jgi:murein DD-endopeptidase MepM/ murein hydrolase activator NlpD
MSANKPLRSRVWLTRASALALPAVAALLALVFSSAAGASPSAANSRLHSHIRSLASTAASPVEVENLWTPVVVTVVSPLTSAVRGTDGKYHVVYELELTNAKQDTATVNSVSVVDAGHPHHAIITYRGSKLLAHLHTLAPSGETPLTNTNILFNESRLLFVELAFNSRADVPRRLIHKINVNAQDLAGDPTPTRQSYSVAPMTVNRSVPRIGSPLRGPRWLDLNGCCQTNGVHRQTVLPVNGSLYDGQRYAIDWMRLDRHGRIAHGPLNNVHSYAAYGAPVHAAASGTVVDVVDNLPDQVPPTLPDPHTLTLETADGNHVIMDIGNGVFAGYAHMIPGSIRVHLGERVRRGQVIGLLGNSGNSSAPHLHFQLMTAPSITGASGLPYNIGRFQLAGRIPAKLFNSLTLDQIVTHRWPRFPRPIREHTRLPLDLDIVNLR